MSNRLVKMVRTLTHRGLIYSLLLSLVIMGVGGFGFWALDPEVTTLGQGFWLAFTTAATVGYGDIIPSTHASRVFAVLVVLMGLGVLSIVTASVAALFVESEERIIERELLREMAALRKEVSQLREELAMRSMRSDPSPPPSSASAQPHSSPETSDHG